MAWHPHNLTAHSGAFPAIGPPVSHVFAWETPSMCSTTADRRPTSPGRARRDSVAPRRETGWATCFAGLGLTLRVSRCSSPVASSSLSTPSTSFTKVPGIPSELWWHSGDAERAGDLSEQAGQPNLFGSATASHVFVEEGTQHVFFTASGQINGVPVDGHVCEFWWSGPAQAQVVD